MENGTIFVEGHRTSCPLSSLTVQFVYRQLLRLHCPVHRCVERYRSWGLVVEWDTVWSNLHLWRFVRPVRDTNWLIAHGILPTADRLARFGMSVDTACHCGAVETLLHLFTRWGSSRGTSLSFIVLFPHPCDLPPPSYWLAMIDLLGFRLCFPVSWASFGIVCGLPAMRTASMVLPLFTDRSCPPLNPRYASSSDFSSAIVLVIFLSSRGWLVASSAMCPTRTSSSFRRSTNNLYPFGAFIAFLLVLPCYVFCCLVNPGVAFIG